MFSRDNSLARLVERVLNRTFDAQETLRAHGGEQGYRNGHREKPIVTRIGRFVLEVPWVRSGEFSTEVFERYQQSERALLVALMEMVISGCQRERLGRWWKS